MLVRKWDLDNLKLPPSMEKKRNQGGMKVQSAAWHFMSALEEEFKKREEREYKKFKERFPFKHNWKSDESFIKFYGNGTFTQRLPYVFIHGTWEYKSEESEIVLKLWEGSKERLLLDFINEDSLSVKIRFEIAPNSHLDKYLFMEFDNCILSFKKDWHFYSTKLTDPFSATSLKWLSPPNATPSREEVKSRIGSYFYYNEKLWEQRSVNQHEFYAEEKNSPFDISTVEKVSNKDFFKDHPWCKLFYDEEGFEIFRTYWNSITFPSGVRVNSYDSPSEKFEAYKALRKAVE